jgi:two-component system chemotaxis response regulator CheB
MFEYIPKLPRCNDNLCVKQSLIDTEGQDLREAAVLGLPIVRDIIVIGASRGGIDALKTIASGLPAEFAAALIVVLHISPDSPRLLAAITGGFTPLKAFYAEDGDTVEHGHLYFGPPAHHLISIEPGCLRLDNGPKERFSRPAADPLFRSAAEVFGSRVIGVVLTGGDGDGTAGLEAIKTAGGISIVQPPKTAVDPSMPLSALDNNQPDYCVPLGDIASLLCRLAIFT